MALADRFRQFFNRPSENPKVGGLVMAEGSGTRHIDIADGTAAYELLYESQPVVAATANKLTRQISTLPLKVYREGSTGVRTEVHDHPLVRLLAEPADRCGPVQLGQWIALPSLVFGNSLLVKVRNSEGQVVGLLPVDWRYTNAYAEMGERIKIWSTIQTGEELWITPSEAVHFAWQGLRGWLGTSPLSQLSGTLRLEDAVRRYQNSSFDRGVRSSGLLVLDKDIDPHSEQGKRIRAQLKKLHEGVDNAGRTMMLGGGADFKPMSMTAVEADLILQRKLNREEVEMVYDIPPPVVQDLEHGTTYENADALHRHFYKTTLRPWLSMIEGTLKAQLIDPEPDWRGLTVRFDLSEVLRGDRAEEITAMAEAVREGIVTINEARMQLGINPAAEPEADQLLIQANNVAPLADSTSPDAPERVATPQ